MSSIGKVRETLASVQGQVADLRKSVKSDGDMSMAVLADLQQRLNQSSRWNRSVKDLEDVPGLKTPKWYMVEIPFAYGESRSKSGEVLISAEGPFVCTQVQTYFRITDTDTDHYSDDALLVTDAITSTAVGRIVSGSSYNSIIGDLQVCRYLDWGSQFSRYGVAGNPDIIGQGHPYPEFDLQIHIEGSGRAWSGDRVPAAAFYGTLSPLYTGISGVIEHSDRIEIIAEPSTPAVNLAGTLNVVFHGYHIGGITDFYTFLGY